VRLREEVRSFLAQEVTPEVVRNRLAELAIELEMVRCLTNRHAWLRLGVARLPIGPSLGEPLGS